MSYKTKIEIIGTITLKTTNVFTNENNLKEIEQHALDTISNLIEKAPFNLDYSLHIHESTYTNYED